jgi:hypothetical protein
VKIVLIMTETTINLTNFERVNIFCGCTHAHHTGNTSPQYACAYSCSK